MKMRLTVVLLLLAAAVPASAATPRVLASQDVDPVWSPDGTRIAFTRVFANHFALEVYDAPSRTVRRLAASGSQLYPSWQTDGTFVAYQLGGAVWSARPDGTDRVRVTADGRAPAWRPGESELAWVSSRGLLRSGSSRSSDVWAEGVIGRPAWSPDGARLAYERSDGIYVAPAPGEGRRVAAPGPEVLAVAWSRDGARLAYAVADRVWVVSADGSSAPRAVSKPFSDIGRPSWSHDDTKIAFQHRGGVDVVTPAGATVFARESPELFRADVAFAPATDWLADSEPRASCPGHRGIARRLGSTRVVLTGSCAVTGTPKPDVIEGTLRENDAISGGAGNDGIYANDGHTDRVDCGTGRDTVYADRQDRLRGCERVL